MVSCGSFSILFVVEPLSFLDFTKIIFYRFNGGNILYLLL